MGFVKKIMYFDVESTGTNPYLHAIHQMSGEIEINDVTVREFDYRVRPHLGAKIDEASLKRFNLSYNDLKLLPAHDIVFRQFHDMITEYIDITNPMDRLFICGYHNGKFDNPILEQFFILNMSKTFPDLFHYSPLDVVSLAIDYLFKQDIILPSYTLHSVAKAVGIEVDKSKLHDAGYDYKLTKAIYKKITVCQQKNDSIQTSPTA